MWTNDLQRHKVRTSGVCFPHQQANGISDMHTVLERVELSIFKCRTSGHLQVIDACCGEVPVTRGPGQHVTALVM